jgi:hypothetical protein
MYHLRDALKHIRGCYCSRPQTHQHDCQSQTCLMVVACATVQHAAHIQEFIPCIDCLDLAEAANFKSENGTFQTLLFAVRVLGITSYLLMLEICNILNLADMEASSGCKVSSHKLSRQCLQDLVICLLPCFDSIFLEYVTT